MFQSPSRLQYCPSRLKSLRVSSLRCLHSPTGICSVCPLFLGEALIPSRGAFALLSPEVPLLPLGVSHSLTSRGILLSIPWSGCRWSCQMAQRTPSQMPTLGKSTSFRLQPRTMRLGHGATGVWLPMPHPGLRNHDTSPLRPRPRVSLPFASAPCGCHGLPCHLALSCSLQLLPGIGTSTPYSL
jgi:hypothetical protein